jgi:hypothetical protein
MLRWILDAWRRLLHVLQRLPRHTQLAECRLDRKVAAGDQIVESALAQSVGVVSETTIILQLDLQFLHRGKFIG